MNNTALSPFSFLHSPSPKFSVIIPVYNVAPYLRACLDSVIAAARAVEATRKGVEKVGGGGERDGKQSVVEIICVDDGSTDGCGAILDEYAEKFNSSNRGPERASGEEEGNASAVHLHLYSPSPNPPAFRILHQKNAGVSAARNAALTIAQGEWVIFVDADDLLCDTALRDLSGVIARHQDDELVGFDKYEFDSEPPQGVSDCEIAERCVDLSAEIPDLMAGLALYQFAFRRDKLRGLSFKPYIVGEDLLFLCEIFSRVRRCWYINRKEYAYRHRAGSVMRTSSEDLKNRKIRDQLGYLPAMFDALMAGGKRLSHAFSHIRGNAWIEGVPFAISTSSDRRELFRHWLKTLDQAAGLPYFSAWQKFVIGINRTIRWWLIAYLTCVVPHRLKLWRAAR